MCCIHTKKGFKDMHTLPSQYMGLKDLKITLWENMQSCNNVYAHFRDRRIWWHKRRSREMETDTHEHFSKSELFGFHAVLKMRSLVCPSSVTGFCNAVSTCFTCCTGSLLMITHGLVTKPYNRNLRYSLRLFWPGLKANVVQYCCTCKTY